MMIIDWLRNSKKIVETGKYTSGRNITKEQIYLMKYLHDSGKTQEEIFSFWKSTESPHVMGAGNEEDLKEWFNKFWDKAMRLGDITPPKTGLTKKEIDYINGLDVELFFKRTLAHLIMYCRGYGYNNKLVLTSHLQNYLVEIAVGAKEVTETQWEKMTQWNDKYRLYTIVDKINESSGKVVSTMTLNIMDLKNGLAETIDSFEDYESIDQMFVPQTRVCSVCGCTFMINSKTKRYMCDTCYKKHRNDGRHKDRLCGAGK